MMDEEAPGLDRLAPDLRSALLGFLEPDETLLWVGQPRIKTSVVGRLVYKLWISLWIKLLCVAPIVVGVRGIYYAIKWWVPGGTWPMIWQLIVYGLFAGFGCVLLVTFWEGRNTGGPERIVYALTTRRALGFKNNPKEAYACWWVWHGESEIKVLRKKRDGIADVAFLGTMLRGWGFEGGGIFTRIEDPEEVAVLAREASAEPTAT